MSYPAYPEYPEPRYDGETASRRRCTGPRAPHRTW